MSCFSASQTHTGLRPLDPSNMLSANLCVLVMPLIIHVFDDVAAYVV